ncbi:unnamed protein product [Somion occarium]|uniref:G-alpha-domain-containing protein n=1 Tax=Somion occarium TaxID=3059160 RepID=A0ABP1DMS1_9APHY
MVLAGKPGRDDPLAHVTAPPPDETEEQRQVRLMEEAEAQRVSDAIDYDIQQEKAANFRGDIIKVLLLGQSESGSKSTTLKNFQLLNSPKAFKAERASWRAVVLLNVVRSIRTILEAMSDFHDAQNSPTLSPSRPTTSPSSSVSSSGSFLRLSPEHLKLKLRLLPLLQVEESLIRKLTPPGSPEFESTHLSQITNLPSPFASQNVKGKEIAVNSQFAWKGVFSKVVSSTRDSFDSAELVDWEDPNDPGRIIHACSEDMIKLWKDPTIQKILRLQQIRLEDMGGFFLDDLERVTSPRYIPTNDDILRARLKTLGVSEHRFKFKEESPIGFGGTITREWRVYDVGGQRSLRAAWAPYFDDVNCILFLAPISAFDQVLEEDPTVNRLEDSVLLWKSIVSNKLLAATNIVLFLNKTDILKQKLQAGIKFADHLVSYGDRPNDFESTSYYLRKKFAQIQKDKSPQRRGFFCHMTTVTDPKATSMILIEVQDTVVRKNLAQSHLVS